MGDSAGNSARATPPSLALLWAIYVAEGGCRASVPFGWLPAKRAWQAGQVSLTAIASAVMAHLHMRWRQFQANPEARQRGDFIRYLARQGYNANPAEWDAWENNVRALLKQFEQF